MASRSSSVKPNRARTGAASAMLSTSLAVTLPPASASNCEARPSSGLVWISERSASLHPQPVRGMRAVHHVAEPEVGDDQRCIGLDVGAHHQDVARLQRRVVLQQAEQHLAQHVDLTGRAVAAVHLHRAVIGRERATLWPNGIGGDVGLQPTEQGVGSVVAGQVFVGLPGSAGRRVAVRAGPARASPAADGPTRGGWCLRAGGLSPCVPRERPPQLVAGVRQPQVQFVVGGQRLRAVRCRCRPAGCARTTTAAPAGRLGLHAAGRRSSGGGCAGDRRRCARPAPARVRAASPGRRRGRSRSRRQPVDEQLRTLPGVGGEQPGQPACHRVAPASPQLGLFAGVRSGPDASPACAHHGSVEAGVDDFAAAATSSRPATTDRRRRCR